MGYLTESKTSAVTLPIKSCSFLCFPLVPITINTGLTVLAYSIIASSGIPSTTSHLNGTSGNSPASMFLYISDLNCRIVSFAFRPFSFIYSSIFFSALKVSPNGNVPEKYWLIYECSITTPQLCSLANLKPM